MNDIKISRLSVKIRIVGVVISALFLISNLLTEYPLFVPIILVVANGLLLLGNYIIYRKVSGSKKVID